MTNGIFIKVDSNIDYWLGVNNKKYWTATHMSWGSCKAFSPVRTEDLEKYKWIPLSSKELVWWEDE